MKNILISNYYDEPLNLQFSYPRISDKDYNRFYDIVELSEASAVRYSNLWKELIKKTHREPNNPMFDLGFVTSNGVDVAYSYWNRYNKYWLQVEGSLDYVRQAISEKSVKK